MHSGDPRRNRQAQPGSAAIAFGAGARFVGAKKALKNPQPEIFGNPRTGILDAQTILRAFLSASESHFAADRSVLDGVIQQIQQHSPY